MSTVHRRAGAAAHPCLSPRAPGGLALGAARGAARAACVLAAGAALALGACATPGEAGGDAIAALGADGVAPPDEPEAELARYRIGEGESLSGIADRLSFPGGWRALAAANGLRGDRIRAGAALRVPVAYVRDAGLDPYRDFHLEPLPRQLGSAPLVPCRDRVQRGACVDAGADRVCVEATPSRVDAAAPLAALPGPDDLDYCDEAVDGAEQCADEPGRVLVRYRGGGRTELAALPARGDSTIELHQIDLDGDGRDEWVAAVPIEIRNHLAWQWARAVVLDADGAFAASFDVAQWGEGSLIEAPGGGCDVLATTWEDVVHPIEGDGTYLVGRRLAWQGGELVPRAGEVLRRMRAYFHVSCGDCDGFGPQTPAAWLAARDATWWPELGDGHRASEAQRGTIVGARVEHGALVLDVALGGRTLAFDPNAVVSDDARPRDVRPVASYRLGPTGATLPDLFVPAHPERWLGRDALAIAQRWGEDDEPAADLDAVGEGEPERVVWIDPPPAAAPR